MKHFIQLLYAGVWLWLLSALVPANAAAVTYRTLGQPDTASTSLLSRCADANAQFNFSDASGFAMHGAAGIAVDPRGRLYVTDFAGKRVLTWPNVDALQACQAADGVIGAGTLSGPEAVAVDIASGVVFVADTLSHTVKGFKKTSAGWQLSFTLGQQGVNGSANNLFYYPRGLAVDARGRLLVADDYNNRVLMFDKPFTNNKAAADSIGAYNNGGFNHPKGLAIQGETLFVSDYGKNRVLRFTGPFNTPDQVYTASASFTGLNTPVDLAVHPDGSLLVTDQGNQRIARYSEAVSGASRSTPSSTFADYLNPEPLGIAADRAGRVYIADYQAYRVLIRDELLKKMPITASSSAAAKSLLTNLYSRPAKKTQRVMVGQMLLTWDHTHWQDDWNQYSTAGLPLPKMMGGEIAELTGNYPNNAATQALLNHGLAGNTVTLGWHAANPTDNGLGFGGTPLTTAQLKAMLDSSTAIGQNWQAQLTTVANYLQQYKNNNIPVLFRPLHEQNGGWFWWGHPQGLAGKTLSDRQAAWSAVWRDMVSKLTVQAGLNNLLFVFSPNQVSYNGIAPPLTYYPGGKWVDIVGMDTYDEELDFNGTQRGLQHYAALIGTGKPFGMTEFGQSFDSNAGTGADGANWDARTLVTRIKDSYPRTAFAMAWNSSVQNGVPYLFALPDVAFAKELLTDPLMDVQPQSAVRSVFPYTYTRDGSATTYALNAIVYQSPAITPTTNRPLLVLMPGWNGSGDVVAPEPSATAKELANEGYIVASIGFKQSGGAWESDLPYSAKGFLQAFYAANPHSNPLTILWGTSYSGLQDKKVAHYLRSVGLPVRGFLSADAGYAIANWQNPSYADTSQYSVAMVQNLGDSVVNPDVCQSWGDCGARERAIFHRNRGDAHVYSQCYAGGSHGTRPAGWHQWTKDAIKQMIHSDWAYPTWSGVIPVSQTITNSCQ